MNFVWALLFGFAGTIIGWSAVLITNKFILPIFSKLKIDDHIGFQFYKGVDIMISLFSWLVGVASTALAIDLYVDTLWLNIIFKLVFVFSFYRWMEGMKRSMISVLRSEDPNVRATAIGYINDKVMVWETGLILFMVLFSTTELTHPLFDWIFNFYKDLLP